MVHGYQCPGVVGDPVARGLQVPSFSGGRGPGRQEGAGRPAAPPLLRRPHQAEDVRGLSSVCSLLNANKINCLRVNTFQDLQSLSLLSLYDNKLQTVSKGLFAPLQAIQTL